MHPARSAAFVSRCSPDPSAFMTQIAAMRPPFELSEPMRPSGANAGQKPSTGDTCAMFEPSASIVQIDAASSTTRAKTIFAPS